MPGKTGDAQVEIGPAAALFSLEQRTFRRSYAYFAVDRSLPPPRPISEEQRDMLRIVT